MRHALVHQLESTRKYFATTLSVFEPADGAFAPHPDMFTVAGQVAHAADTVDWFMGGAFGAGWDMEFDAAVQRAKAVTSLSEASDALVAAFERAIETVSNATDEELLAPIPNDVIMNGAPRSAVIGGIVDHTAHHRGSLAVYARLLGKVPPMPYA
jgi:uncharacterized damage-inducible protein DinB